MVDIRFRLTNAQRLVIQRRRFNETQIQAAMRFKISVREYRRWEGGSKSAPFVIVGHLHSYERYFLLRREANLTQETLAKLVGVTEIWIHKMETGVAPVTRLAEYWNKR